MNVWIALTFVGHSHHSSSRAWLDALPDDSELCFCRLTQIGFLRLLTTSAVMGNKVLSQEAAWQVYDSWLANGASFLEEPSAVERAFRALSQSVRPAAKDWADSYVCAFAQVSGLRLVTFDQALQRRTANSILLTR